METKLNPILINKAVDIYATTPNVQHKDVADELGINYKTLLKLRKDADFWKKVWGTLRPVFYLTSTTFWVCVNSPLSILIRYTPLGRLSAFQLTE